MVPAGCRRSRRGRAGRPGGAEKGVEQRPDGLRLEVAGDEHDAGARVAIGPGRQPHRRMEDVLHAVNHQRRVRRLGELHDALEPQQVRAVQRAHAGRGTCRTPRPGSALSVASEKARMRSSWRLTSWWCVMAVRRALPRRPRRRASAHVGDLARGIVEAAVEEPPASPRRRRHRGSAPPG